MGPSMGGEHEAMWGGQWRWELEEQGSALGFVSHHSLTHSVCVTLSKSLLLCGPPFSSCAVARGWAAWSRAVLSPLVATSHLWLF